MSIEKLNDERLEAIAGGMTAELKAAYACIRGDYGNGAARVVALRKAGFDPEVVQSLVNSVLAGNEKVALDVIDGKYGNDQYRIRALTEAGYDAGMVQAIVNGMLLR